MAVHARASRERWEAEQEEHAMSLQDTYGSPASDGPGDQAWQAVLAQLHAAQHGNTPGNARMS